MQDAAELYERAGLHERAATIYIQARAFALAAPLMALITHNPKLQLEFAKAKESKCALKQKPSQLLHVSGGFPSCCRQKVHMTEDRSCSLYSHA